MKYIIDSDFDISILKVGDEVWIEKISPRQTFFICWNILKKFEDSVQIFIDNEPINIHQNNQTESIFSDWQGK